jgi:hypothetical protein
VSRRHIARGFLARDNDSIKADSPFGLRHIFSSPCQHTQSWRRVKLTHLNGSANAARTVLAEHIFAMARQGERDPTPKIPVAVCQNGFMDYSVHPLDPLPVRLTLAGPLDTIDLPGMATELRRAVPAFTPTIGPGSISAASAKSVGREPTAAPSTLQRVETQLYAACQLGRSPLTEGDAATT